MIPIVKIPELISHYAPAYAALFTSAGYEHFQRYLSGLLICENKTVTHINQAFILSPRDPSTLNRFLTQGRYTVSDLNACRLSQLQANEQTRMRVTGRQRGVLGIDDTFLSHVGKHFDHIAKLWDHSEQRYTLAHNMVNLYYSDPVVEYPIDFELWQPADLRLIEQGLRDREIGLREAKLPLKQSDPKKWKQYLLGVWSRKAKKDAELNELYRTKGVIAMDLLKTFFERYPQHDLPIAFDSWFTTPQMCKFIDKELKRTYVGALKADKAELILSGSRHCKLPQFIEELKAAHLSGEKTLFHYCPIKAKDKTNHYYTYCKTHRIKNYGRVRIVINFKTEELTDDPKIFISNRLEWRAATILNVYKYRWPVEPFHQEAKAQGLDKYQIRDFEAITKHIAFVIILFSILTLARKDPNLLNKLQLKEDSTNQSLAFWRRLISAQTLLALIQWVKVALEQGKSWEQISEPILKAFL